MLQTIPETRAAEAARLAAVVEANRHLITVLPGPKMLPPPCRRHPDPKPKPEPRLSLVQRRRQKWGPVILAKFDEGLAICDIQAATGLGRAYISAYLADSGRDPAANRLRQIADKHCRSRP